MNISQQCFVVLSYQLRLNNSEGVVIETVDKSRPLQFIHGYGQLLPAFEKQLEALAPGQHFSFSLTSDEAYGSIREEAIVDVPLSSFEINGKVDEQMIQVGKTIPMRDHHGNHMNGKITRIDDAYVTMDFNHPLAGQHLHFEGEILNVRQATEEELNQLNSGHSCCGGDGQCEDGCHSSTDGCGENAGTASCGCGGHH